MASLVKIKFCGGTGSVTGANFLLETRNKKILVDCGLSQGIKIADDINWDPFPYDPKEIDMLFITHAHVDHLGRIPKLIHDGFRGKIFSTPPTKALVTPMLEDTMGILVRSREYDLDTVYTEGNIKLALSLWQGYDFHQPIKIAEAFEASFLNAGHILGSAMVQFNLAGKKILFTGDLGNTPSMLLPDTEIVKDIDYLITESVYGDRNHESGEDRKKSLEKAIKDNYQRKGTLIIPTFSLERSQELLFELNDLVENKKIPVMPIFLDSPLAIRLTEIFKRFKNYFNQNTQRAMAHDKHIFDFPGLRETLKSEESKMILAVPNPKVIIAGSGMSSGGRIVHHEKNYLPDPNNTLVLIGYQSVGSPGRLIQEGVKTVRISGEDIAVRARIVTIFGYSGHRDSDGLVDFVGRMTEHLKKVFIVMGEPKSSMFLAQRLKDNFGLKTCLPERGESFLFLC